MNSAVIAEYPCCTYSRAKLSLSPPPFSTPFANYSKTNSTPRHTQSLALAPEQEQEREREPETRTGPGMNRSVITITRPCHRAPSFGHQHLLVVPDRKALFSNRLPFPSDPLNCAHSQKCHLIVPLQEGMLIIHIICARVGIG